MTTLMPRFFGEVADWFGPDWPVRMPHPMRFEDHLTDKEYVLRVELPGLDPEKDIEVSVDHGILTVQAERSEEATAKTRAEFRYGALHRSVRLPANADEAQVKAAYSAGILEITVPLTAPQPSGRKVPVTSAT